MQQTPDKVLVVDDNPGNRALLQAFLQKHNFDIRFAFDGEAGLAAVAESLPSIILLDLCMPKMDGKAVLKSLRQQYTALELPILIISALDQVDDVIETLEQGANDYITKPFNLAVVKARIDVHLNQHKSQELIRKSEERFSLAMRGAREGILDWDYEQRKIYFSPVWYNMLGLDVCQAFCDVQFFLDRIHPKDKNEFDAKIQNCEQGKLENLEHAFRLQHKDGSYRWVNLKGLAIFEHEKLVRLVGSQIDTTDTIQTNPLTGLSNEVLFSEKLQYLVDFYQEGNKVNFAISVITITNLPSIQASFGALVTDDIVKAMSPRIKTFVHDYNVQNKNNMIISISSYKNNDFLVLIEGFHEPQDCFHVAHGFELCFDLPVLVNEKQFHLEFAIGAVIHKPEYINALEMIDFAVVALNKAKSAKELVGLYDSGNQKVARENYELEMELREAIQNDEFWVAYQPIICLQTQKVIASEALLRWQHPTRGVVSPGAFIEILEKSKLIVPVSQWLIKQVCIDLKNAKAILPEGYKVHINISANYLKQGSVIEDLINILEVYQITKEKIKLELTESVLIDDIQYAESVLTELSAMGFELAIDDFGTGYSSLSYLQRLPFNSVKMDRVFIEDMMKGGKDKTIVETIVHLSHQLKMNVVAEGIETQEQADVLTEITCNYGQGYFYSRPVPITQFNQYLKSILEP